MSDVHVFVMENDVLRTVMGASEYDPGGPLVFEQYVNKSSLSDIHGRTASLNGRYGKCRIARLEFLEDDYGGNMDAVVEVKVRHASLKNGYLSLSLPIIGPIANNLIQNREKLEHDFTLFVDFIVREATKICYPEKSK